MLIVSLLCVSCDVATVEPVHSLVGAQELPPDKALSLETLYIVLGGGVDGGDSLSYEWRPDSSLTITHSFSDGRGGGEVIGSETTRITSEVASQVRRLLWRVRPGRLEGAEQDARPLGCERQSPHDLGELTVGFVSGGSGSEAEDDEVGVFALPSPRSCNTPAAVEARAVIRRALRLLPRSEVVAGFKRST